jgi:hypothetical protein
MELKFLDNTKIAVASGILSEDECVVLHNYAVETKAKENKEARLKLEDIGQHSETSFLNLDNDKEYDLELLSDFWGAKNVFTEFAPQEILDLVTKLKQNCATVFSEYLKAIDYPRTRCTPGDMQFQAIHVYSEGHSFTNHVDCFEFAVVFYMSDPSEFTGGDLIYDAGPRITPSRGTIVIAPSDMPHEVLEVTSGYRCSMTTFLFRS